MTIYADAFKKCADNIIALNGVPHNNWNLLQAHYIMNIALILEDDAKYADSKGRQYYIHYLVNQSSIRQWSLKKLADYGFMRPRESWAECPGYSSVVVGDYASFVSLFDEKSGHGPDQGDSSTFEGRRSHAAVSLSEPYGLWVWRYASFYTADRYFPLYDSECPHPWKIRR